MKHLWVYAALMGLVLAGSGCSRYHITLTNGNVITAKSKPKLDPATDHYHFKDATGKEVWVPSMRIRSIEAK
jgi:penicillin V acylase-like amidase (Ntn superfamily)